MSGLFLKLLNMSISASVLIVVVVLARCLLRKSPKWIHCILWALVGIRLLCPFQLETTFSLAPNAQVVSMCVNIAVSSRNAVFRQHGKPVSCKILF